MGHKKGASKRQESRQAKQGYARQGEAGRCRTMGGHRGGAGGAGTGDTGARTICCVGREGKAQRGKHKSSYTQSSSPNLGYHLYPDHDYQCLKSPIEGCSTFQIRYPGSGGPGVC